MNSLEFLTFVFIGVLVVTSISIIYLKDKENKQ